MITYAIIHEGMRIYRDGQLIASIGPEQFLRMISEMARVLTWQTEIARRQGSE